MQKIVDDIDCQLITEISPIEFLRFFRLTTGS